MPASNKPAPKTTNAPRRVTPPARGAFNQLSDTAPVVRQEAKFYSPDGEDIRVCLPGGDVAVIVGGAAPRELPKKFHREAIRAGAASTSGISQRKVDTAFQNETATNPEARAALLEDHIGRIFAMYSADPSELTPAENEELEDALTSNSESVNLAWLSKQAGFNVERTERDVAVRKVKQYIDRIAEEAAAAEANEQRARTASGGRATPGTPDPDGVPGGTGKSTEAGGDGEGA